MGDKMDVTDALEFDITESSQVGEALRNIVTLAHNQGFNEAQQARLKLVCTELATNLLKHTARGGRLIAQALANPNDVGVEVFSIDSGPGMNIQDCLTDGFSSAGTMGTGLGAVKRNAESFDIYSEIGVGSVVQARLWNSKKLPPSGTNRAGLTVPKRGELVSGDKWCIVESDGTINCLLIDGLGHGIEAADAANLAVKRFKENIPKAPAIVMEAIHKSLRGTRGAVGAVAQINSADGKVHFCGLGNISALVVNETSRKHLTSFNGTLGYEARRFQEYDHPWGGNSILLMHSDGLSSKTFEDIYTIQRQSAPIVAAWLYQKYSKGNDDSTMLVCKGNDG